MTLEQFLKMTREIPKDNNGCQAWPLSLFDNGYPNVRINGKQLRGHRVVLSEKLGREIIPGMFACHSCDNAACVNPDHLWEGSQEQNMKDMVNKGRSASKERNAMYGKVGPWKGVTGLDHPRYGRSSWNKGKQGLAGDKNGMYGKRGELSPHFGKPNFNVAFSNTIRNIRYWGA